MKIRRLGSAGVEVSAQDGTSLVVGYIQDNWLLPGAQNHGEYVASAQTAAAALVTHLHADHTDVTAIESAVGPQGLVLRPPPIAIAPAPGDSTIMTNGQVEL